MELNSIEIELKNTKNMSILFNDKIYRVQNKYDSLWFYDYYKTKVDDDLRGNKDKEISNSNAVFVLYLTQKTYLCFGNESIKKDIDLQKRIYQEVIHSLRIIKDESEVDKIHLECLKKKIVKKLSEVITKEQVLGREIIHMSHIKNYITDLLKVLADKLYVMADNALTTIDLRFDLLDEDALTQNKGVCIYYEQLKITTYKEYINHLFSKEYGVPDTLTTDYDWLGEILIKQCTKIFPHINFFVKEPPKGSAFPIITAKIDYTLDDALL
jgi:hypothetical protein